MAIGQKKDSSGVPRTWDDWKAWLQEFDENKAQPWREYFSNFNFLEDSFDYQKSDMVNLDSVVNKIYASIRQEPESKNKRKSEIIGELEMRLLEKYKVISREQAWAKDFKVVSYHTGIVKKTDDDRFRKIPFIPYQWFSRKYEAYKNIKFRERPEVNIDVAKIRSDWNLSTHA